MDYREIGERLRQIRVAQGLTQSYIANKVGITPSFYGHIERGSRKPSLETMVAITNALNISLNQLLGNLGEPDESPIELIERISALLVILREKVES
jgi:transcriptional regulator with XRE-family HTH domain